MRTFAAVFVGGAVGLLLLKLLFGLLAPLFALLAVAFKLLLLVLVAYFVYALVRGKKREREDLT